MSFTRHRNLLAFTRLTHGRRYTGAKLTETDSCGIPLKPMWSVHELLSSYPEPTISSTTLKRIHELSALIPPNEGTLQHEKLQQELGGLVKLVEAVKLVDTDGIQFIERHCRKDWDRAGVGSGVYEGETGQTLLRHASRTASGLYVVDADRKR